MLMRMAQQAVIRGILLDASFFYLLLFLLFEAAHVIPTDAATEFKSEIYKR